MTNVYYVGSHGMDIMAPLKPVDEIDSALDDQAIKEKVLMHLDKLHHGIWLHVKLTNIIHGRNL